jgi:hypothetical protein
MFVPIVVVANVVDIIKTKRCDGRKFYLVNVEKARKSLACGILSADL